MESSGVVVKADCNNCLNKYTGETERNLKERVEKYKDHGEKSGKDKTITGKRENLKK